MPHASLALENAALHRLWSDCTGSLVIVKPATMIGWNRQGFKAMWRRKSRARKIGRPRIPCKHIDLIRRISGDHPGWGEDKIAEELAAKFAIQHSPGRTCQRHDRPTLPWVNQQIREVAGSDNAPRFLIHDNGGHPSQAIHGIPDWPSATPSIR